MNSVQRQFQTFWRKKRNFLLLLTVFSFIYFLSLPSLTSYFPDLVNVSVYEHITIAWFLALSQFFFVALITLIYFYISKRLDQEIVQLAKEQNKH